MYENQNGPLSWAEQYNLYPQLDFHQIKQAQKGVNIMSY